MNKSRGAIAIRDATKTYDRGGAGVLALDHCSLDIAAGEICVIVGPSGCGKTTLLNAVAGFHTLDGGTIHLDGALLCGPSRWRAPVGPDRIVVFQNGSLFPWKTNLENVAFGPIVQGRLSRRAALDRARQMLAEAGLSGFEHEYPGQASSGIRRRVEIVRALMNDPTVLLLDEPFRALDPLTRSVMHQALLDMYDRNRVTIIFITHDLEEAIRLGDRVVIMTARPGRPKTIVDVGIQHPRDHTVTTSRRFRELVQATAEAVQEEALASFERGESEAIAPGRISA